MGAERLLGKGDMLYLKPGNFKFERIQGAFLDDSEVVAMVDAIKVDGTSHYNQEATNGLKKNTNDKIQANLRDPEVEVLTKTILNGMMLLMLALSTAL